MHLGIWSCLCLKPLVECCPKLTKGKMEAKAKRLNVMRNLTPFLFNFHPVTVKDIQNVTNWKNAYFEHPAPYLTDKGFPNPPCSSGDVAVRRNIYVRSGHNASEDSRLSKTGTYVIGEDDNCMAENNTEFFCNGPLKPNTVYV